MSSLLFYEPWLQLSQSSVCPMSASLTPPSLVPTPPSLVLLSLWSRRYFLTLRHKVRGHQTSHFIWRRSMLAWSCNPSQGPLEPSNICGLKEAWTSGKAERGKLAKLLPNCWSPAGVLVCLLDLFFRDAMWPPASFSALKVVSLKISTRLSGETGWADATQIWALL